MMAMTSVIHAQQSDQYCITLSQLSNCVGNTNLKSHCSHMSADNTYEEKSMHYHGLSGTDDNIHTICDDDKA